jgi:hypothetical protein
VFGTSIGMENSLDFCLKNPIQNNVTTFHNFDKNIKNAYFPLDWYILHLFRQKKVDLRWSDDMFI